MSTVIDISALLKLSARKLFPLQYVLYLSQADNGVVFIGPSSYSIKCMGDKLESKRIAMDAKINLVPGFDGEIEDENHAVKVANDIG